MLTTCAAVDEDVTHFAMIHDSFGTHAADAEKLARMTREQFVKMYTPLETENDFLNNDILLDFVTSLLIQVRGETAMKKTLDATLRNVRGTLDLEGVIKSKYFFS
jgi:DNA-directed RNA polymerase